MEQYHWSSLGELFQKLNDECNYLIMRNYENLKDIHSQETLHDDIDFLCDDYRKMVQVMDARPRHFYDNKVQYQIMLGGLQTKIDIRHVGDKYYDTLWQKEMLESKCWNAEGFFVMNERDYFYSLIYHAVLQKKMLAEDYRIKLTDMAFKLGINAAGEQELLSCLIDEMRMQNYSFCYPEDSTIPNRFYMVPGKMCTWKASWYLRKAKHFPLRVCSFIYNKVLRETKNVMHRPTA